MSATKWIILIVGVLLFLMGIIFALQGANILGGSALMSGNPKYIYVGTVIALVGVVFVFAGVWMKARFPPSFT